MLSLKLITNDNWVNVIENMLFIFELQFSKESGHNVEECKLRVVYVPPPQPPSPVREGSDEGSSPRASFSDNGNVNASEFTAVSICYISPKLYRCTISWI